METRKDFLRKAGLAGIAGGLLGTPLSSVAKGQAAAASAVNPLAKNFVGVMGAVVDTHGEVLTLQPAKMDPMYSEGSQHRVRFRSDAVYRTALDRPAKRPVLGDGVVAYGLLEDDEIVDAYEAQVNFVSIAGQLIGVGRGSFSVKDASGTVFVCTLPTSGVQEFRIESSRGGVMESAPPSQAMQRLADSIRGAVTIQGEGRPGDVNGVTVWGLDLAQPRLETPRYTTYEANWLS